MEPDPTSIHEWLEKMPDDLHAPLDDQGDQDATRGRAVTNPTNHNSTIDLVGLDDAAPIITTARNFKLWDVEDQVAPQDLTTGVDNLPHITRERIASLNFDRKPRARTREDRYEYKGKDAEQKSDSGDRAKKRLRRSRKHTLNDGFHAPNVTRERLTLRSHMNGGIFSKAKSSCPVRLQDNVSVPADARFSARGNDNAEDSPPRTKKVTKAAKGDKNRQMRLEYNFLDSAQTAEGRSTTKPGQHLDVSAFEEKSIVQSRKRPREPERDDLSREARLRNRPDGEHVKGQPETGVHIDKEGSKSPTPYTWSETDKGKPTGEHDIEADLLKRLRAGVSLLDSELHTTDPKDDTERIYLTLEDLKALMDAREAFWPPETREVDQNLELPTTTQKPSVKRTMPVADMKEMCTGDSPGGMDQVATHRSKKAKLRDPAEFEKTEEVRLLTRQTIKPEDTKTALHSRQLPNQYAADADEAKNNGHKRKAVTSMHEEIPKMTKTNIQPTPSPTEMQKEWQLEVTNTDRRSPGISLSNWLGDDDDLPLLPVDEMVDCENQTNYHGQTTDNPTLTQPQVNRQLGFLATPAYNCPARSVDKDQDEIVPPGFWRRNRLY